MPTRKRPFSCFSEVTLCSGMNPFAVGQHSVLDQFLVLDERLAIDNFTHYLPNGGAEGVLECFLPGRAHAFGEDCLRVTAATGPFGLGARFCLVAGYGEGAPTAALPLCGRTAGPPR